MAAVGLGRQAQLSSSSNQSSPRSYTSLPANVPDHSFITKIHLEEYHDAEKNPEKTSSKLLKLGRKFRHVMPPITGNNFPSEHILPNYEKYKRTFGQSYQWIGICKYRTKLTRRGDELDKAAQKFKSLGIQQRQISEDENSSESDDEVADILSGSELLTDAEKLFKRNWWQFIPNKSALDELFPKEEPQESFPSPAFQNALDLRCSEEEPDSPIQKIPKIVARVTPPTSPIHKPNRKSSDDPLSPMNATAETTLDIIKRMRPPSTHSNATDTSLTSINSTATTTASKISKKSSPDKRKISDDNNDHADEKKPKLEKKLSADRPKRAPFNIGRLMRLNKYTFENPEFKEKKRKKEKKKKDKALRKENITKKTDEGPDFNDIKDGALDTKIIKPKPAVNLQPVENASNVEIREADSTVKSANNSFDSERDLGPAGDMIRDEGQETMRFTRETLDGYSKDDRNNMSIMICQYWVEFRDTQYFDIKKFSSVYEFFHLNFLDGVAKVLHYLHSEFYEDAPVPSVARPKNLESDDARSKIKINELNAEFNNVTKTLIFVTNEITSKLDEQQCNEQLRNIYLKLNCRVPQALAVIFRFWYHMNEKTVESIAKQLRKHYRRNHVSKVF